MANKTFIKSRAVYQSPVRRDQNDIELIGFSVAEGRGGVFTITQFKSYIDTPSHSMSDTQNSGSLVIGNTYVIAANTTGVFTNVGALNNDADTQFDATGTTPTSWGDAVLIVNPHPIATVWNNTLGGQATWKRIAKGYYDVITDGLFPIGKTIIPPFGDERGRLMLPVRNGSVISFYTIYPVDENTCELAFYDDQSQTNSVEMVDAIGAGRTVSIEINVYP